MVRQKNKALEHIYVCSSTDAVIAYIEKQMEHHQAQSFED